MFVCPATETSHYSSTRLLFVATVCTAMTVFVCFGAAYVRNLHFLPIIQVTTFIGYFKYNWYRCQKKKKLNNSSTSSAFDSIFDFAIKLYWDNNFFYIHCNIFLNFPETVVWFLWRRLQLSLHSQLYSACLSIYTIHMCVYGKLTEITCTICAL